jgi:pimeloyl-ACP methyl ester carboxylesterase
VSTVEAATFHHMKKNNPKDAKGGLRMHLTKLSLRTAIIFGTALIATLSSSAIAGDHHNKTPLVIADQGMFFMGGDVVYNRPTDNEDITEHQMYVQYQVPAGNPRVPVVFTHGCCLSSASWQTTPDGRPGWDVYFLRKGHSVYLTDQSGRGRSGFDATPFNLVQSGQLDPSQQPAIFSASHQRGWDAFRFGPALNVTFAGLRFPIDHVDELYKEMIPDLNSGLPNPNPTYKELADLAVKVHGAVLVGHSESGRFPIEAALTNPAGVRGLVSIEGTDREFTDAEIAVLKNIPILVLWADFIDLGPQRWRDRFAAYTALVDRINAAGGNATLIHLPEIGIHGNSHMMMLDNNSDQVAGIIDDWIRANVEDHHHHHGPWRFAGR